MPLWQVIKILQLGIPWSVPQLLWNDFSCNGRHGSRGVLHKTKIWIHLPGRCCQSCHTWTWWSRKSSPLKEEKNPWIQGPISEQVLSKWFKNGLQCPTDPQRALKLPARTRAVIWLYNCKVTYFFLYQSQAPVLLLNICDLRWKLISLLCSLPSHSLILVELNEFNSPYN